MDDSLSSRKRARAAAPSPARPLEDADGSGGGVGVGGGGGPIAGISSSNDNNTDENLQTRLLRLLKSDSMDDKIVALNELLQFSHAPENMNNVSILNDELLKQLVSKIAIRYCIQWDGDDDDDEDDVDEDEEEDEQNNGSIQEEKKEENDAGGSPVEEGVEEEEEDAEEPVFRSKLAWTEYPLKRNREWIEHCKDYLGPIKRRGGENALRLQILDVILTILRNLSFVGANLRMLAYEPRVVQLLVGCLHEEIGYYENLMTEEISGGTGERTGSAAAAANSPQNISLSAVHTLFHISPFFEVSGQKVLADRLFYKPPDNAGDMSMNVEGGPNVPDVYKYGQTINGKWGFGALWFAKRLDVREDTISDVDKSFVLEMTSDYLVSVYSVFPAITHVLCHKTNPPPRSTVLLALDLLQEFINQARTGMIGSKLEEQDEDEELPTIRSILVHMPDCLLEKLVHFLYVPRLNSDSMDYVDPCHNIVTRVSGLLLLRGYDASVDTDIRDRSLDILVPLCELDSPNIAARLAKYSVKLMEAVLPILTTNVGRNEAPTLAFQMLRELALSDANRTGFMFVQDRLVEMSSRDPRIAQLVWNHLYAPPPREGGRIRADSGSGSGTGEGSEEEEADESGGSREMEEEDEEEVEEEGAEEEEAEEEEEEVEEEAEVAPEPEPEPPKKKPKAKATKGRGRKKKN